MIKYDKLFKILEERGHTSNYYLRQNGIHTTTVMRLKKNERINSDTINALCKLLDVQPSEILEYVEED
jgi:Predicted transcriptional regulator